MSIVRIHRRGRKRLQTCRHDPSWIHRGDDNAALCEATFVCNGCNSVVAVDMMSFRPMGWTSYSIERDIVHRFASIRRPMVASARGIRA